MYEPTLHLQVDERGYFGKDVLQHRSAGGKCLVRVCVIQADSSVCLSGAQCKYTGKHLPACLRWLATSRERNRLKHFRLLATKRSFSVNLQQGMGEETTEKYIDKPEIETRTSAKLSLSPCRSPLPCFFFFFSSNESTLCRERRMCHPPSTAV